MGDRFAYQVGIAVAEVGVALARDVVVPAVHSRVLRPPEGKRLDCNSFALLAHRTEGVKWLGDED